MQSKSKTELCNTLVNAAIKAKNYIGMCHMNGLPATTKKLIKLGFPMADRQELRTLGILHEEKGYVLFLCDGADKDKYWGVWETFEKLITPKAVGRSRLHPYTVEKLKWVGYLKH